MMINTHYISDEDERLSVWRSEDTTVNEYGKNLLGLCQEYQLRILNGRTSTAN